ncbi:hypothetical protein [Desertimonas flava]|uniref:hypothetical protein n=1 Tax=Desertimonas flava TaxID=2064846 RepID=UPI000E34F598|nr:hypothetical protein [Desertimonas flava]
MLIDETTDDGRGLGAAIVWALRNDVEELNVVAERGTGVLARRAGEFVLPIRVWSVDGTSLVAAVAEPAGLRLPVDPRHLELVGDIEAGGARLLLEHGAVTGDVRGLEVCRVVDGDDRAVRLEVGVGAHDREAFAMIHGDRPTRDALAEVVATVTAVRDVAVPAHPLNRLGAERFLRWQLEEDPAAIGLESLEAAEPPVARPNLKDPTPCAATGRRRDGSSVIVVTSVGIDLDVIPYAADARLALAGEPGIGSGDGSLVDLLVVAPSRDLVTATRQIAGCLRQPVTLVPSPFSAA